MDDSRVRVGLLTAGEPTERQRAALEWADLRYDAESVGLATLADPTPADYDVLWWHRGAPSRDVLGEGAAAALRGHVADGGGLLLSLRAPAAVADLGIEPVAPNETGVEEIAEPTGPLWKVVHGDHPAVAGVNGLRAYVADRGEAPYARYVGRTPRRGEVLASTVTGDHERPGDVSVVSWYHGDGAVLGVGAPLTFETAAREHVGANRSAFAAGLVTGLAAGLDERYARPETGADLGVRRRRLADDRHRPRYHLTPPGGWLNDPNGLVRWNDRYHVFYQYNPAGPFHDTIHWGHAVSDDLVTWEDEPVALSPSPDGPDRDGCWSGCAVVDDGTPTLVYTGGRGREQLPCLATAEDPGLRRFRKHEGNPVIDSPPAGLDVLGTEHWEAEFRDHCVWREDDRWHHLVGTGVDGRGGAVVLYTGAELTDWRYEGPVLIADGAEAGPVWECPELLRFDGGDLLHVSDYENVLYFVGDYGADGFDVADRGLLDYGDFYAPQSMRDDDRYLTWGWLPEARDLEAQWSAGWSGTLSIPREVTVEDGTVRQRPAPELEALRTERSLRRGPLALPEGERRPLPVEGRALELSLTVELEDADEVRLSVFESPDREEVTEVGYHRDSTVYVDRSAASLDPRATTDTQVMEATPYDEPLRLRAFLDGSTVELFANGRNCLSSRVYPTRPDSTGVSLTAEGGAATVTDVSAWRLGSAWPAAGDRPSADD